jgi:hypothetical protein
VDFTKYYLCWIISIQNKWEDHSLEEMSDRMDSLQQKQESFVEGRSKSDTVSDCVANELDVAGWHQLRSGVDWQPCALGVVG